MTASDPPAGSAERPPRSPLEGGVWRPLAPEELLRKGVPQDKTADEEAAALGPRMPPLERRQELERFIKDRPADMDAYLELAAIYRQSGRSVEATRVLKAALEVEPEHAEVLWQLEEARLARALQQLRDVREMAARVKTPEADRELERAQTDWACRRVEVCRDRLARDPSATRLRVVLGEALRDLGDYEEAIEAVAAASEHEAEAAQANLIQAQCQQTLGRHLEALASYRRAALRRAAPAPAKLRVVAMRAACSIATNLGLVASAEIYQQALRQAESEAAAEQSATEQAAANSPLGELPQAPANPPPATRPSSSSSSQPSSSQPPQPGS
ncbi:tetratricopeptide repeat protein [Planctomycetaceae bacterium SH139]